MTATNTNLDYFLARLSERVLEHRGWDAYCAGCEAAITQADRDLEQCSQCGAGLVEDESADEDLWNDEENDQ